MDYTASPSEARWMIARELKAEWVQNVWVAGLEVLLLTCKHI